MVICAVTAATTVLLLPAHALFAVDCIFAQRLQTEVCRILCATSFHQPRFFEGTNLCMYSDFVFPYVMRFAIFLCFLLARCLL